MKRPIMLSAVLFPGVAFAQVHGSIPQENILPFNSNRTFYEARDFGMRDTPAMADKRLKRALALKQEAAALLEADGGTFTNEHERYVRRKAREILGY